MRIRKLAQNARQLSPADTARPLRQIEPPIIGDSICPPGTRRACTNEIVHHPIHGNQNQVAQAVAVVPSGTLGRICKSASTVFINLMARSG